MKILIIEDETLLAESVAAMLRSRGYEVELAFDGITGLGMTWSENGEVSKSPKGMVIENGKYVGM